MSHPRRAFAWLWVKTGFQGARDALRREGVLFTLIVAAMGAAVAWWRASGLPVRFLWSEWPWDYEGKPGVSVGDVVVVPLGVIGACCLFYLIFHLFAAPYRMGNPDRSDAPATPQQVVNVYGPTTIHQTGGAASTEAAHVKVDTLWVPRSVADDPRAHHDGGRAD